MWLWNKIKQLAISWKSGVVTLRYPFEPRPAPVGFRGQPIWDHTKCIGCAGCANHCPPRTIFLRDICQEIRVLLYDSSRCTYCGRCADLCPEKAITMSDRYELATDNRQDITQAVELFMMTCQRCGRCYDLEIKNSLDKLHTLGYRYDSLEVRKVIRHSTAEFTPEMLEKTKAYERPKQLEK
ncbi:MAG TPA: 4Fe-4S dicluster domain-containing protein [Candidatus Aminicenantes bacterium]|nr:4Fe-4S dicluster domain-containing protein [Candidatus Aminicenantes bacterium]